MSQESSAFVNMDAEKKASLRHFLSAAMIFSTTWPKEPVTAQQKAHGDAMYARALAAFDEWFELQDGRVQQVQEPELSGLKPQTQERIREWLADGTFVSRAIGTMQEQERELIAYETKQAQKLALHPTETKGVAKQ
ncbi:hypothetical protein [Rhodoferax sp.]|uniref:hypothetical protein n=1 Tax=Rhodoferax sp. TaxID=50421 RepID=UPI002ACDF714|nr:hypothetical protein [Rhodoferax sp.]MDZ7920721.1 hypothetical protein [Rhodoferax sp.]